MGEYISGLPLMLTDKTNKTDAVAQTTHLIFRNAHGVDSAGAPARFRLPDLALRVAHVALRQEGVVRPVLASEVLQDEAQQSRAELGVFLVKVVHVHVAVEGAAKQSVNVAVHLRGGEGRASARKPAKRVRDSAKRRRGGKKNVQELECAWQSIAADTTCTAVVRVEERPRTFLSMQNSQPLKVSFSLKHPNNTSEVANTAWAFRLQYELARVSSGRFCRKRRRTGGQEKAVLVVDGAGCEV